MKRLELLYELYRAFLKLRHSGSLLGFLWTLLNPAIYILIYWFVFSYIITVGMSCYFVFLITGFLAWNFTFGSLNINAEAINQSKYLITKIAFPHEIIIIANALIILTDMLIAYLAFFALTFFLAPSFIKNFIYFPIILIPQIFFTIGLSFIVSTLSVYYKDIPKIVTILGNIMFFVSPILYPIERTPEHFELAIKANIFAHILTLYHKTIYYGENLDLLIYIIVCVVCFIVFFIGRFVFKKYKIKFAELA